MDDQQLLLLAKHFEPAALKQLHNRCYSVILRYMQMKISDSETRQDLTSEVLLRMLNQLKKGQGWQTSPEAWALGIARYIVADFYREQFKKVDVDLDEQTIHIDQPHLSQRLIQQEQNALLLQAIQTLTQEQREVIVLRFMIGLSLKEVAEIMSKREGAIKGLQYRAIQAMAKMIVPDA